MNLHKKMIAFFLLSIYTTYPISASTFPTSIQTQNTFTDIKDQSMNIFVNGQKVNFPKFQPTSDGEFSLTALAPYLKMTLNINHQLGEVSIDVNNKKYKIDLNSSSGKYDRKLVEIINGVETPIPNTFSMATAYFENGELISDKMFLMSIYDEISSSGNVIYSDIDDNQWANIIHVTTPMGDNDPVILYKNKRNPYNNLDPKRWLEINLPDPEARILHQKAMEITKTLANPSDQAQAIYNWVTNHIYYDWDSYKYQFINPTIASEVQKRAAWTKDSHGYSKYSISYKAYKNETGVCTEYACLMNQLLKAVNIPSRLVSGNTKEYHFIVEFYIDGTWYIADPTWGSRNTFTYGKRTQKPSTFKYFKLTPEQYVQESNFILDGIVNDEYGSSSEVQTYESLMKVYGLPSEYDLK